MNRRQFLSALGAAGIARAASIDWNQSRAELLQHHRALLRLDTTNPPGNETRAAEYLRKVLESEGISSKQYGIEPNRMSLVARLSGSGMQRPLLIMGHTDTVGIQRDKWTKNPFDGEVSGGFIYGRGANDDKDSVAACLMTMLLLKRLNTPLKRDVIFLAEAGEEGTTKYGIDYLVAEHWSEIEAEYAIAEGGFGLRRGGQVQYITVTTTEKAPRGYTLKAHGTAAHGSVPTADNVVPRLAKAVARISEYQPPVRLNATTRAYFERMQSVSSAASAAQYRELLLGRHTSALRWLEAHEPEHASMLHTTIVPTVIQAGFRSNVIPSEAEAQLDIRALPDEDIPALAQQLKRLTDDPGIEILPRAHNRPVSTPSRLDTACFRMIESVQKRLYPNAVTIPSMLTGATDMAQLRARGVQCYGIGPYVEESDLTAHGAHSDDERISEEALYTYAEFLYNVVIGLAAA